jgi:cell division cycle 20, cofactor of APC complex
VPDKILDAPELLDDYYLNLLDWSSTNMLSVALGQTVYLWNASSGGISELAQVSGENYITSVSWVQGGGYLAVGTAEVRQLELHSGV